MSYSYDVMEKAWATLKESLSPEVREGELAMRFGFLISAMHEANHQLNDGVNKDMRVTKMASKIDALLSPRKE